MKTELDEKSRMRFVFRCFVLAMNEFSNPIVPIRTDVVGLACQYGKSQHLSRKDFDSIKDLTLNQIMEKL